MPADALLADVTSQFYGKSLKEIMKLAGLDTYNPAYVTRAELYKAIGRIATEKALEDNRITQDDYDVAVGKKKAKKGKKGVKMAPTSNYQNPLLKTLAKPKSTEKSNPLKTRRQSPE